MKKLFGILAAVSWFPALALAEAADDAAHCVKLTNEAVRLACYDTLFKQPTKPDSAQAAPVDAPKKENISNSWTVQVETSKVDDSQSVFLINEAIEANRGPYGQLVRFTLMAACRENSTNVWINFGGFHMSDYQHGTVTYRVDDASAKRRKFRESNNNQALGLWSGRGAIPFLQELMGHDILFVRASPYSDSAVEAEFDISGLARVIEPLRKACNW